MSKSLKLREQHADKLLELDELVGEAVKKLKAAGWTSGYLKPIVVARVNPLRFAKPGKDEKADFDKTIAKMIDGKLQGQNQAYGQRARVFRRIAELAADILVDDCLHGGRRLRIVHFR